MTLSKHKDTTADDFAHFLEGLDEVQQAHSVAGDADYLLLVIQGRNASNAITGARIISKPADIKISKTRFII